MKGYRLNPDKEYVEKIISGTLRKEGDTGSTEVQIALLT